MSENSKKKEKMPEIVSGLVAIGRSINRSHMTARRFIDTRALPVCRVGDIFEASVEDLHQWVQDEKDGRPLKDRKYKHIKS